MYMQEVNIYIYILSPFPLSRAHHPPDYPPPSPTPRPLRPNSYSVGCIDPCPFSRAPAGYRGISLIRNTHPP